MIAAVSSNNRRTLTSLLTYCRDKHDDETGEHRDAVSDSATGRQHLEYLVCLHQNKSAKSES